MTDNNSRHSPEDDSYAEWQQELAELPPADWLDEYLTRFGTDAAEAVLGAVEALVAVNCPRVELLERIRDLHYRTNVMVWPRDWVDAHLKRVEALLEEITVARLTQLASSERPANTAKAADSALSAWATHLRDYTKATKRLRHGDRDAAILDFLAFIRRTTRGRRLPEAATILSAVIGGHFTTASLRMMLNRTATRRLRGAR